MIGLPALLRTLREGGCAAPLGLEVTSTDLAALPGIEVARLAATSIRRVLAHAGWSDGGATVVR